MPRFRKEKTTADRVLALLKDAKKTYGKLKKPENAGKQVFVARKGDVIQYHNATFKDIVEMFTQACAKQASLQGKSLTDQKIADAIKELVADSLLRYQSPAQLHSLIISHADSTVATHGSTKTAQESVKDASAELFRENVLRTLPSLQQLESTEEDNSVYDDVQKPANAADLELFNKCMNAYLEKVKPENRKTSDFHTMFVASDSYPEFKQHLNTFTNAGELPAALAQAEVFTSDDLFAVHEMFSKDIKTRYESGNYQEKFGMDCDQYLRACKGFDLQSPESLIKDGDPAKIQQFYASLKQANAGKIELKSPDQVKADCGARGGYQPPSL